MRRTLLITLELFAISAPLAWLWLSHLRYVYADFFRAVATPFFDFLGMGGILIAYRTRFINVVPFIVLMVVTPGLSLRRRSLGTLLGLLVLFCGHLVFTWLAGITPRPTSRGFAANAYTIRLGGMLFSDSLPFLVWATIATRQLRGLAVWLIPEFNGQAATRGEDESQQNPS